MSNGSLRRSILKVAETNPRLKSFLKKALQPSLNIQKIEHQLPFITLPRWKKDIEHLVNEVRQGKYVDESHPAVDMALNVQQRGGPAINKRLADIILEGVRGW